jgi:flagellar motor switch protein FliN/FliY
MMTDDPDMLFDENETDMAKVMAQMAEAEASQAPARPATSAEDPAPIFKPLVNGKDGAIGHHDIDLILDIPVQMTVELGRTKIAIKNLLQLAQGSVIELDGLAGEPMDVVVNDRFGIRLTDIITPSERIRKLNR